jgi:hypothetical protein
MVVGRRFPLTLVFAVAAPFFVDMSAMPELNEQAVVWNVATAYAHHEIYVRAREKQERKANRSSADQLAVDHWIDLDRHESV